MEQTVKKKIGVRDIMTIAAMMVINFAIAMVIGMVTLPFPAVYLYGSAGIDAFIWSDILFGCGKSHQQTWIVVCLGCCLWTNPRCYGLYVLGSLFS